MAKRKAKEPAADESPAQAGAEYTVLARRYRPQQFADLVGQEPVAQALVNAIESGRVAHAYLFTGARGVGKTSAARILAKALNCEKGPTATPCDQCEICQAITSGDDTDVLEIDGASNNGVDNIRELRANVNFRPSRSRYKIYIIDEVHMLSTGAFNALLKTLEEPPAHVKFIFATTEVQKVPITILSRCQRFDFGGISITRILDRLKDIVKSEGMQADDEALETIARRAGGSMRDAQSLLDQLLAFSGKKLTVDTLHQLLGTAHEEHVTALAGAVLAKDAKKVLELLNDIANQGQQVGELLDQLVEYWRDLMIVNSAGIEGQSVSVSSARRETLQQHARTPSLDTILAGMDILVTAKSRMRNSSHARALVEMALVRMCQLDDLLSISQIAQWLAKEGAAPAARPKSPVAPPSVSTAAIEKKKLIDDNGPIPSQSAVPLTEESLPSIWQQLLTNSGFAFQSELRRAINTAISGPNSLVIGIARRYNAPGSLFADSVRMGAVEKILSRIVGQTTTIRVEWTDDAPESAAGVPSQSAQGAGQQRQLRAELMQIPCVKKAADVLGAQIIRADEGFGAAANTAVAPAEDTSEGE
ncbi:MAG: DNA polymerase III subunit gamma/tau [Gemmataceae bacterium]|nr:DNA polymerase III subunit gamma/tau [Gemmataceae bacterium]